MAARDSSRAATLLISGRARGITLIAPLLAYTSRQARADGYTTDMFTIDWDAARSPGLAAHAARVLAEPPSEHAWGRTCCWSASTLP